MCSSRIPAEHDADASGERKARLAQRPGEPNQWQADEGGGIAALDAFEQRDAERFRPKASGAVVGPLARDVTLDFPGAQRADQHAGRVDVREVNLAATAEHRTGRVEERRAAAERLELLTAAHRTPWLVEKPLAARGHLGGSDDPRLPGGTRPCP